VGAGRPHFKCRSPCTRDRYGIPIYPDELAVTPSSLLEFFAARRARGEPLVLATVFETRGSTYSKSGAHLLIDGNGVFRGMLSGGCLEGDLAARARVVLESGTPQTVTYDLARDDELWGMGVGCDGMIRVFLQAVRPEREYAPFAGIAEALHGTRPVVAATVIDAEAGTATPGAACIVDDEGVANFGIPDELLAELTGPARRALAAGRSVTTDLRSKRAQARVLFAVLSPPPRLLVLGAGPDAEPLVRFAAQLGWRCTVADHRPAYVDNGDFAGAVAALCIPADALAETLDLATFDLAIVMSHHLVSDRSYLRQLAGTDIGYVGLLGPPARRARLLAELGAQAGDLGRRLRGPAGLDLGARGPGPIALSIVAEMQGYLSRGRTSGEARSEEIRG
jgi:xanthine/CO dehydrogenase XdhC/CoxF family maturation factor